MHVVKAFSPRVNMIRRLESLSINSHQFLDPLSRELEEWVAQKTNGEFFRKECYYRTKPKGEGNMQGSHTAGGS